jgi:GT2 family glycosyltransferase
MSAVNTPTAGGSGHPAVSVIVVNWNGKRLLDECLTSLETQAALMEIIVVDNGSTDGSNEVALRHGARWFAFQRNMGLATAFNEGARHATGAVLLFLNNDLFIPPDFVSQIASEVADERVGAVDVRHVSWDGLHATHQSPMFRPRAFAALSDLAFPELSADQSTTCAYVSGACFPIRRELFNRVGGWDSGFFAGWEDVDLSWRLRREGFQLQHNPSLAIRHHVSASSRHPEGVRARAFAAMTGRPRFALKHAPIEVVAVTLVRLLAGTVKDVRRPADLLLRLRAIGITAAEAPSLIRWRRKTYRAAGLSPRSLWTRTAEECRMPQDV